MKLKQVYLTALEPEALAGFYQALGLTVRFADRDKWIQFVAEKVSFCLASPTESISAESQGAVVVFEVDDLEMSVERARAQGAEMVGDVRDMGAHGRVVHLKDPQSNTIQLFQAASK